MSRRRTRSIRVRFFVATEGISDSAFVRWIGFLCEASGNLIHLDIHPLNGGDPLSLVNEAVKKLKKRQSRISEMKIAASFLFLDSDRWDSTNARCNDAKFKADEASLDLVFLCPNLEGVLLRLHRGHEREFPQANDATSRLKTLWPDYEKKDIIARELQAKFDVDDLKRAVESDTEIRRFLSAISL